MASHAHNAEKALRIVGRFIQIDGYRCFSLMRAFLVENCQSALAWLAFRSCCHAAISSIRSADGQHQYGQNKEAPLRGNATLSPLKPTNMIVFSSRRTTDA